MVFKSVEIIDQMTEDVFFGLLEILLIKIFKRYDYKKPEFWRLIKNV